MTKVKIIHTKMNLEEILNYIKTHHRFIEYDFDNDMTYEPIIKSNSDNTLDYCDIEFSMPLVVNCYANKDTNDSTLYTFYNILDLEKYLSSGTIFRVSFNINYMSLNKTCHTALRMNNIDIIGNFPPSPDDPYGFAAMSDN